MNPFLALPFSRAARGGLLASLALAAALLAGCDQQRIAELQPGVSTEADVRLKFGEPEAVWDGAGGERIFEYNRQPEGKVNYQIAMGTDGRLVAVRQVLTADNFRRVVPGMRMEEVRKLLGKPARVTPYTLKREVTYEWRYIEPPNQNMVFSVDFDDGQYTVKQAASMIDPQSADSRAGR
ncbi:outer membrane protein assembly factor BamE [Comamonas serinivorans]|uniref:Outer membrane protein assembly factor BamE n=1 Tax=Comamonas serinivorans TaxID=1082851 RepID=A0A1Y0ENA4_9BURK|nr:outer membrane protein assembly factor BamE [Comamonas serinivorans]ARU04789.1 outer membrane protein assembly factor BamE [Comamonas serinivorans]